MHKIEIVATNHEGMGIGYIDAKVIFVLGAVEGDFADVKITKTYPNYYEGEVLKILDPSDIREKPSCPLFLNCGGCQFLNVKYQEETKIKKELAVSTIKKFSGLTLPDPVFFEAKEPFYRNKIELSFQDGKLGFFKRKTHFVLNIGDCIFIDSVFREIICDLQTLKLDSYNEETKKGIYKDVVFRKNVHGDVLINFLVSRFDEKIKETVAYLVDKHKAIKGVIISVTKELQNRQMADEEHLLFGGDYLLETVDKTVYKINYQAFFQVNTEMHKIMLREVKKFVGEDIKNVTVVDLYSGVGAFSCYLAPFVYKVIGIELNRRAYLSSIENGKLNSLKNVEFINARVEEAIKNLDLTNKIVIIDPPRKGMPEESVNLINNLRPSKIIYVSCNDATLGRDLKLFKNYIVKKHTIIDMFPRTTKTESVMLLERRN